jgi:hypothetical protein
MGASRSISSDSVAETKPRTPTVDPSDLPPWTPDLNVAKAIRVTGITSTSAKLEWPVDFNGAGRFRVERLMLTRDSAKELRNAWVEIPKTTFAKQGPTWVASLTGLRPQSSQTVRIVPLNAEGRPGEALFRLDFYTPPQRVIPKPSLTTTLIVILLTITGVTLWRRIRRQFSEPISGF